MKRSFLLALAATGLAFSAWAQNKTAPTLPKDTLPAVFSGLKFRSIGPAITSGRIADIAVDPNNRSRYFVAVASGGVWKTINAGTTFEPVFDSQGSYSIGCITMDPTNPHVLWVGTGENNGQRSVAYGDGVYKSEDGGKSWKNVGLKTSEHIGKILVDPRNPDVVYAAAIGPLWSAGGERGIYKTTDGGTTWKAVLTVDEHTGASDLAFDPRNPDVIYATTHQRRRHVFTYISGGPGSALYKSTDAGQTWKKLSNGIPKDDLGRIGIAVSPVNPDMVYAIIEATGKAGGFYRSADRGASWNKMSDYSTAGNYYQEIVCDPKNADRVYAMDTYLQVTDDGGKSFRGLGEKNKHVDNHCMWIDPQFPDYYLVGSDGGLYESFDRGENWHFKSNLPVTQFYKVATDNAEPFYHVYGGTQDNFSLGGPSRTISSVGIVNSDWYITNGGDGFESQADRTDPNIIYAQSQYGWLTRYDKQSGEKTGIKPIEGKGEPALRWNWDAPLHVSVHAPARLYFAANKVFRSDDRGDSWTAISGDLTRQIDRNKLKVMGKVWSMDAVAKNQSTTIYGTLVAFSESPKDANLLYAGSDDGLIHVTEDGGQTWRKIEGVAGVPDRTYVNFLLASQHDENVVYAAFNNHKNGDFKPYLYRSGDRGKTWTNISSNLPERGSTYCMAEDHKTPNLLFAGTEFGAYASIDGGRKWIRLKGGLPTIAIRDMEIQKREDDLVLASFGRGFYILDDITPLRNFNYETLSKEAHIFPIKDGLMYVESTPLGRKGKTFQGESYFASENPPLGATFTYYLRKPIPTLKEQREKKEKALLKSGADIPYPGFDEMRAEDREEKPLLVFLISDESGSIVRRMESPVKTGVNRITWDGRHMPPDPPSSAKKEEDGGPMAVPGQYYVAMAKVVNGVESPLADKVPFTLKRLNNATLAATDKAALLAFEIKLRDLQRALVSSQRIHREMTQQIGQIKTTLRAAQGETADLRARIKAIEDELYAIDIELNGDRSVAARQFETPTSLRSRVSYVAGSLWGSSSAPGNAMKLAYEIAGDQMGALIPRIHQVAKELEALNQALKERNAPWTPGRLPEWNKE